MNSAVHKSVLLLLHSLYHCDVFWHLHVAIFLHSLSEVVRQPILKAATQLCVVLRLRVSGAIRLLLLLLLCVVMVWCLLDHSINFIFHLHLHTHFFSQQVTGMSAWRHPRGV